MHIVHHRRQPHLVVRKQQIHQLFERTFANEAANAGDRSRWIPRVDVREEAGRFIILADLPGLEPDQIEIRMDKGVLSISGQRSTTTPATAVDAGHYARSERPLGCFQRDFALPDSADADGIVASGRNGVLEISIPKKVEASPRRIQVGTAPMQ